MTVQLIVVHTVGLIASIAIGDLVTGWILRRLRLLNDAQSATAAGPVGAGRIIGRAERFLVYCAIALGQASLIAALIAIKTIVRYPEVKASIDQRAAHGAQAADGDDAHAAGHFAEYYLVGTLVSLSVGVAFPLLATGILRLLA